MTSRGVLMRTEDSLWTCSAWDHRGKCMKPAARWFHNPKPVTPLRSVQPACGRCGERVLETYGAMWKEISRAEVQILEVMES